jgi:hypothetical protein
MIMCLLIAESGKSQVWVIMESVTNFCLALNAASLTFQRAILFALVAESAGVTLTWAAARPTPPIRITAIKKTKFLTFITANLAKISYLLRK